MDFFANYELLDIICRETVHERYRVEVGLIVLKALTNAARLHSLSILPAIAAP
jgi:hypothetical protein